MYGQFSLALQKRKLDVEAGFNKTVHLEKIVTAASPSPLYKGEKTTEFSIEILPPPLAIQLGQEDVANMGNNLQLGDFIFEIWGSSVTETQLKEATQIKLGRSTPDEKTLQILQYSVANWTPRGLRQELAIIGGIVQRWWIFTRGQIVKP